MHGVGEGRGLPTWILTFSGVRVASVYRPLPKLSNNRQFSDRLCDHVSSGLCFGSERKAGVSRCRAAIGTDARTRDGRNICDAEKCPSFRDAAGHVSRARRVRDGDAAAHRAASDTSRTRESNGRTRSASSQHQSRSRSTRSRHHARPALHRHVLVLGVNEGPDFVALHPHAGQAMSPISFAS